VVLVVLLEVDSQGVLVYGQTQAFQAVAVAAVAILLLVLTDLVAELAVMVVLVQPAQ
jgi:hypothetical protein